MRQRFCEHRESFLWLLHGSMCFGEECQKIGPSYPCSRGTPSHYALAELLNAFLRLPLLRQRPATQHRTDRHPGKSPFLSEADGGFGVLLDDTHLATELMEYGSKNQDKIQVKGLRNLLRQCQRFVDLPPPLGRIAKQPQRPHGVAVANHTSILPIEERIGAVLLGVVERYALGKVRVCRGWCSQMEQGRSQGTVCRHAHRGVLGLLCQGQELLAQCVCLLVLGAYER